MFCSNCGKPNGNAPFCQHCGSPLTETVVAPVKEEKSVIIGDNVFAVAGFLLSLISLIPFNPFFLPGMLFSILGLIKCKKLEGKGTALSIWGLVFSVPALILGTIFVLCVVFIPAIGMPVMGAIESVLLFFVNIQADIFFG